MRPRAAETAQVGRSHCQLPRVVGGRCWRGLAACVGGLALMLASGCGMGGGGLSAAEAAQLTGGDTQRGRMVMDAYGCDACHTVPGIPGADRMVGPPLDGLGGRMYIAGRLANNPDNLVRWIRNPPAIDPRTAMPFLGVSEQEARDISAYLYSLP